MSARGGGPYPTNLPPPPQILSNNQSSGQTSAFVVLKDVQQSVIVEWSSHQCVDREQCENCAVMRAQRQAVMDGMWT